MHDQLITVAITSAILGSLATLFAVAMFNIARRPTPQEFDDTHVGLVIESDSYKDGKKAFYESGVLAINPYTGKDRATRAKREMWQQGFDDAQWIEQVTMNDSTFG